MMKSLTKIQGLAFLQALEQNMPDFKETLEALDISAEDFQDIKAVFLGKAAHEKEATAPQIKKTLTLMLLDEGRNYDYNKQKYTPEYAYLLTACESFEHYMQTKGIK